MAYMKNSILKYDDTTSDNYIHKDFTSFDYTKIHEFVDTCQDDIFDYYQMGDNDKMERIAFELYGSTDYWDILLLINDINALYGMPYSYDIIEAAASNRLEKYKAKKPDVIIPDAHSVYMHGAFENIQTQQNEVNRVIKIVKPSRLQDFLKRGYEMGCFL
jgi:hypothetical protein